MKAHFSAAPPGRVAAKVASRPASAKRVARFDQAALRRYFVPVPETVAALLLGGAGFVHGWLTLDAWGDAHYKGVLFGLNALFCLACALNLRWGDRFAGWIGGALICAASVLAYVASRTVGLPQLPAEPGAGLEPLGVLSLVAEVGFLVVFARAFVYDDEKDEV